MPIITSNVTNRTFLLRWRDSNGTGFTLDLESKQYLITARHVVSGIRSGDTIDIFHDGRWKKLPVDLVGIGKDEVDVAVLAFSIQLSPWYPLPASEEIRLGESVCFVGYPFGWNGGGEEINRKIPIPLVKAGVVSAMQFDGSPSIMILDAQGNPGFSGGPVLFVPPGEDEVKLHVTGVVSSGRRLSQPVTDPENTLIGHVGEDLGFVFVISIECVLNLIGANSVGFQLPSPDPELEMSWGRDKHVQWSKHIDAEVQHKLNGLQIPPLQYDGRAQLAYGSLANVIGHSRAITFLVEKGHDGSALALARPCFEAFVRAIWLRWCATDDDIRQIGNTDSEKNDFPPMDRMIGRIRKNGIGFDKLESIKEMAWDDWCSHTHGGWQQIRGQLSARGVLSPTYDPDEVELTLIHSDHWCLLSAALLAEAAGNHGLAKYFYNLFDEYDESVCLN